jgi:hypothetical protein
VNSDEFTLFTLDLFGKNIEFNKLLSINIFTKRDELLLRVVLALP